MVLHLSPFPARLGLGQPHHADFVILRVNAWGKSLIKSTESLCKAACVTRCWAGLDQPGNQGLLASRGQRSIWGFPLCRYRGKGLGSRQLPPPVSRESAPGGAHARAFVCQPACVSANTELSCSSSQLIMSREELGKACW